MNQRIPLKFYKAKLVKSVWVPKVSATQDKEALSKWIPKGSGKFKINTWYIADAQDTTCGKSHFIKLKPKSGGEVTFGDNSKGIIKGIDSIGKNSSIFIENILCVNGLKHNLLSISQLCDKGLNVIFESNGRKIIHKVRTRT
ncbi:Copia protein [Gossypium australe]|uniref:Copia protein n=1 Tax=Gossypium australe TaxID=47621 RepID=A0A5B6X001_9ROSI|nr:Copia protein [Gossypium australe]